MNLDACPMPFTARDTIQMAHGGGGRLMNDLLRDSILPALGVARDRPLHDGAVVAFGDAKLAFTTDSYVVSPLFFPGGDIGSIAVNGTINDLAMCGARPLFLSCALIIEEGLSRDVLGRVLTSMRLSAEAAGVRFVTGDTKVVDRGKGDGLYVNTAGVGLVAHRDAIGPGAIRPGDAVILSGDIGRHAIAVMAARADLALESAVESDAAPLHEIVADLLDSGVTLHCLRDLTRGGLASALVELAEGAGMRLRVKEDAVAVSSGVQGACELLGFDPLYLANEGRCIAVLPADQAERALTILRRHAASASASIIGTVESASSNGTVVLESRLGTQRPLVLLSGEQLPRIC